jgi:hypothetical protein
MRDGFKIQILADGATKITSEGFSGEKHLQAEQFRAWIAKKLGGSSESIRNTEAHTHSHDGESEHDHDHDHHHDHE